MRELKVNKKLKKKIVGYGYKNTREWTQAKIKRIIFIDIFAAIPEVAARSEEHTSELQSR